MTGAADAVTRLLETYDRKDPAALPALYTTDAEIVRPGAGTLSPQGLAAFFAVFVDALPDFTHDLTHVIERGHSAAFEATLTGTFTGTLQTPNGPVAPTGNTLHLRQAGFLTIADSGQISVDVSYLDQLDMLTQLGLMSTTPTA